MDWERLTAMPNRIRVKYNWFFPYFNIVGKNIYPYVSSEDVASLMLLLLLANEVGGRLCFSRVCLSVYRRGPRVTIRPLPMMHWTSLYTNSLAHPTDTAHLFMGYVVVAFEAGTVCKRVECFLVSTYVRISLTREPL